MSCRHGGWRPVLPPRPLASAAAAAVVEVPCHGKNVRSYQLPCKEIAICNATCSVAEHRVSTIRPPLRPPFLRPRCTPYGQANSGLLLCTHSSNRLQKAPLTCAS